MIKDDDFIASLQFSLLVTLDPVPGGTILGATGEAKLARASKNLLQKVTKIKLIKDFLRDHQGIKMMKNNHIQAILRILKRTYPDVKTALRHRNPLQLLIATILSAQCTDERVNEVTKVLFKRLKTAQDFAKIPLEELEMLIRPTGFFKNKAKSIKGCCAAIVEKHGGRVPNKLEALVKLPGVGRKTANVVLGGAFGIPGIVVDTHVKRLSQRLGLTTHTDPVKIEMDLMKIIPKNLWNEFSLQLIFHGRKVCKARKPACSLCPLNGVCPYPKL